MSDMVASAPLADQSPSAILDRPARRKWRLNFKRFFHEYKWTIVPFLAILIFQIDTHYNYGMTWLGQDEPAHSNNVLAIVRTGDMPPPIPAGQMCEKIGTCEGFQPPWFYDLVAFTSSLVLHNSPTMDVNAAVGIGAKITLLVLSLIWFVLIIYAIQLIMPRRAWFVKGLIAATAMLIPQVLMIDTMVSNDYGEMIAALAALIVLYLIMRTDRKWKPGWWLLAGTLTGLCTAIKLTGVQTFAVYIAVALCIATGYLIRRQPRRTGRILLYAALGVPLIALGLYSTVHRALTYLGHELVDSHNVPYDRTWNGDLIPYLTTFQMDVFQYPMYGLSPTQPRETYIPGYTSFWSVQYVGLFSDPLDVWLSAPEFSVPPALSMVNIVDGSNRFQAQSHPLSIIRFAGISLLMQLSIPIGLLLLIGLLGIATRFAFHPRRALHSGTLVILLAIGAALGSFLTETLYYHSRDWFTRPRYALAAYVLVLIAGADWVQRLGGRHRGLVLPILRCVLWTSVLVFCVASYKQFWLTSG